MQASYTSAQCATKTHIIYFLNSVFVKLKLEQSALTFVSNRADLVGHFTAFIATQTLWRDPRFSTAKYRRALTRWRQGRLAESLVDLARLKTQHQQQLTLAKQHHALVSLFLDAFAGYSLARPALTPKNWRQVSGSHRPSLYLYRFRRRRPKFPEPTEP
ncbi:hypothetical protein C8R45DRAFT_985191 [Mycena sanguinolenta]|nr:hypothetical protein C8R45DRAFT_985191 [Mycena sanguinolenta]